ncbi:endonuclease/exonuclease/phosphatase family protein [Schleiferia thermophila]|uniref:Endonuclease/exonuclease/phosphatase family metal-dependent hydrolase n=1 Tax=Schleiferia thermophila TaxID=884107 RepID=A0A369A7F9_9FLAO|nr:endonuclease/exonuclease/phosphatase family protein [Schleiferia thermophila]KFD40220.1 hypothetical protein AT05_00265 [Schleiferia thermophila str. Yellowstone]RCX05292.1 endonuclease/exonuclease/phosphatase family metal-dependent hydrolase [Schleiferia thermophila]GCD79198.1 endonuclease [Schleiferia thermophila]
MKKLLNLIIYSVHISVVFATILSGYSYFIPPDLVKYIGIAGLLFPVFLIVNVLLGLYWILQLNLRVLLTLGSIALVLPQANTLFQNFIRNEEVFTEESITVTTFNVRLFNHWHWFDEDVKEIMPKLLDSLGSQIVGIQEYYQSENTPKFNDFKYQFIATSFRNKNFGMAIFSKFPIAQKQVVYFQSEAADDRDGFIYADIKTPLGMARVVCAHLVSFKLTNEDLEMVENPSIESDSEQLKANYLSVLQKINRAFEKRAHQVRELKEFIIESPHPVILLGDLNDTPVSYTYKVLSGRLQDTFTQAGTGIGHTYNRTRYPFRIDYIFHSSEFKTIKHMVTTRPMVSDHYPVTAVLIRSQYESKVFHSDK